MEEHPIIRIILSIIMFIVTLWSVYNCGKGVAYTEMTKEMLKYRLAEELTEVKK